jgi:hypothetical protein
VIVRWVADVDPDCCPLAAGAAMWGTGTLECAPANEDTVGRALLPTIARSSSAARTNSQAGLRTDPRDLFMLSI